MLGSVAQIIGISMFHADTQIQQLWHRLGPVLLCGWLHCAKRWGHAILKVAE
jgi:hypothetical protein